MLYEYTFYFANPLHFLLNFYAMKKIFSITAIILVLTAVFAYFHVNQRLSAVSLNENTVILEIPKGSSPTKVLQILQAKGIWKDDFAFTLWCKLNKPALKAGFYEVPAHHPAYLQKSFPDLDTARWNKLVQDPKFARSLGIEGNSLEGYLLPDTYPFAINSDEESILRQMVAANFKVRDEMKARKSPMWDKLKNWHRVLTLASVVEEETGIPDERPLIAGVFHNRLDIGMPLGADPTVRFIFKNLTGPIYKSQLNSDSPYNTRKFPGLMPGPISNPGRKAIEATLFPAKTEALYFVAKDDGSHTHFFSTNLADHNKYKDVAAKNRGEKK